ncbi:MAG: hypothetical protein ACE5JP_07950 [Candidatus Bipolaricaulia bacterium]
MGWVVFVFGATIGATGGAVAGVRGVMGGAVGGAVVGIAQWLVLRKFVKVAGWVAAATVSWAMAMVVAVIMAVVAGWGEELISLFLLYGKELAKVGEKVGIWAVVGIVIGVMVGTAQWLILRNYVKAAWWWVGTTTVGWAVFGALFGVAVVVETELWRAVVDLAVGWTVLVTVQVLCLSLFRKK